MNTYTLFSVREQRGFFIATEVVYCGFECDKVVLFSHHGVCFFCPPPLAQLCPLWLFRVLHLPAVSVDPQDV